MMHHLIEGEDFYYTENGYLVFTADYHRKKGNCCGFGCRHCPYNYMNVPEPKRTKLLKKQAKDGQE